MVFSLTAAVAVAAASTGGLGMASGWALRLRGRLAASEHDRAAQLQNARSLSEQIQSQELGLTARDTALQQLVEQGMPALLERLRDSGGSTIDLHLHAEIAGSEFAHWLRRLTEEMATGLRAVESNARTAAAAAAAETTAAAVVAVATGLVSLTVGVSQNVGEALERHTGEPVYETLSGLDHRVQQALRLVQNYLVMFGGLPGRAWPALPLNEVVRGALGRVVGFERVRIQAADFVVEGPAVEPAVHVLANLLDNALRYSPERSFVEVSFQVGQHGVAVIVDDAGLRMSDEDVQRANQVLAGHIQTDPHALGPHPRLGFEVIARLGRQHGFHSAVQAPNQFGGTRAVVLFPFGVVHPPTAPAPGAVAVQAAPVLETDETQGGLPRRRRRAPAAVTAPAGPGLSQDPPSAAHLTAWMNAGANNPAGGTR